MKAATQMMIPCAYGSFSSGAVYFKLYQQKTFDERWYGQMLYKLQQIMPQKRLWEWSMYEY